MSSSFEVPFFLFYLTFHFVSSTCLSIIHIFSKAFKMISNMLSVYLELNTSIFIIIYYLSDTFSDAEAVLMYVRMR